MVRHILLHNTLITYTLRRSRRGKMLRVTVRCGGAVSATVPYGVSKMQLERFLRSRSAWLIEKIRELRLCREHIHQSRNDASHQLRKRDVCAVIRRTVEQFNRHYGFAYNAVRLKNQRTLWGSCSDQGNLNFNFKLSLLSEALVNYVIVHELCHLRELNHSAAFWRLVAETIPDYRALRRELKQTSLHAFA